MGASKAGCLLPAPRGALVWSRMPAYPSTDLAFWIIEMDSMAAIGRS